MKSTDKPSPKEPRDLSVQPEDAADVRGGWFIRIPPLTTTTTTTTTSTSIKTAAIPGESLDEKHKPD